MSVDLPWSKSMMLPYRSRLTLSSFFFLVTVGLVAVFLPANWMHCVEDRIGMNSFMIGASLSNDITLPRRCISGLSLVIESDVTFYTAVSNDFLCKFHHYVLLIVFRYQLSIAQSMKSHNLSFSMNDGCHWTGATDQRAE